MALETVLEWSVKDVKYSLKREGLSERAIHLLCDVNEMDGKCLLVLNETDFQTDPLNRLTLRDRKCLYLFSKLLQRENQPVLAELGVFETQNAYNRLNRFEGEYDTERISPTISEDGKGIYPAEKRKALLSFLYLVAVTWITAFVMVIVHDRVPDMEKYPPLPDIFLDNVPLIPWAFDMCEMCGTVLFTVWLIVLLFHKHRFILMRRFFALSGTVFLLRCVTMLITSLSVPGAHLQCQPRFYATQGQSLFADLARKLSQAFVIWRGAGLSIRGVRTCGDYMFSGHTVALTMLNFFITEYTPRHIYYLHTLSWMLNMFGIFFILAAHEHYSIDVFVAFYITSRLFLYYHTLSNNQALMQRDSTRTKVWFPLFSYFESSVEGIVPNEYETPSEIAANLTDYFKYIFQDITRNYHRYLGLAPVTSRTRREPRNTIEIKNSKTKNKRGTNSSVDSDRIDLYDRARTDTITSIEDHKPSTSLVDNHKSKSSNLTTEAVTRLKADSSFSSRRSTTSSIQDNNKDK